MTRERVAVITVVATSLGIFFIGLFSGTPIDQYDPKNTEEKQLIDLIHKFHTARKTYNLEAYLACLSETGRFMFSGGGPCCPRKS